jgi:hypothetical protein
VAQPAEGRRALVEQGRVDALDPHGVLGPQVVVALQQRPALQDVPRRDPAFREPALRKADHAAAARPPGRFWRASCGRGQPRCPPARPGAPRPRRAAAPPSHTATPCTPRPRTRRLGGSPAGPASCAGAPGRPGDLPALHLPGHRAGVVEGELPSVDVQSTYDRRHRDLLRLRDETSNTPIVVRLSWGGPLSHRQVALPAHPATEPGRMHVIYGSSCSPACGLPGCPKPKSPGRRPWPRSPSSGCCPRCPSLPAASAWSRPA